jgi:hypothetical protein
VSDTWLRYFGFIKSSAVGDLHDFIPERNCCKAEEAIGAGMFKHLASLATIPCKEKSI